MHKYFYWAHFKGRMLVSVQNKITRHKSGLICDFKDHTSFYENHFSVCRAKEGDREGSINGLSNRGKGLS